jgi:hypothetical protein
MVYESHHVYINVSADRALFALAVPFES